MYLQKTGNKQAIKLKRRRNEDAVLPSVGEEMAVKMTLALGMTETLMRVGCINCARLPPITLLMEEEGIHTKAKLWVPAPELEKFMVPGSNGC